ncbi:hypothetical protein HS041_01060 [Planomonospora sp. ID67723]|uniref:hypothetical protein n=1 Tax=Planomonospora sp. ID67723 TaxID=2738134 RepID=UPI0018C4006F|nr:hypothetical protein [Planomonospora sp. ID67723]MBG0826372.1 hypothetical protein [Planomonospora sp. ID67723]
MNEYPTGMGASPGQNGELQKPSQPAGSAMGEAAQQAKSAAGEVAGVAKEQTRMVAGQAKDEARHAVNQLRERAGEQARYQSRRAAESIRQWADDLASMGEAAKPDSPVSGMAHQVAEGGRRAADYLEQHGLAGVLEEVQNFARRRPGVFLAGALAAGFLAGRMAKATTGTESGAASGTTTTPSTPSPATAPYTPATPAQPVTQQGESQTQPVFSGERLSGGIPTSAPRTWDGDNR